MERKNVQFLAQKELFDALRNRWFLLFAIIFTLLVLALTWLGLSGAGQYGVTGFGRTSASLINLIMLIVPLMGLSLGAMSIASEKEKGTLLYLYTQPVTLSEIFWGKFVGLATSLFFSLSVGFSLGGLVISFHTGTVQISVYFLLILLTFLILLFSLGLGLFISGWVKRSATAIGIALFGWLFLVFLCDLGVMGTAVFYRLPIQSLFYLSLLNPLQVFKIASVLVLQGNLEILGPVGVYSERVLGENSMMFFLAVLVAWIALFPTLTPFIMKKKGVLS